MGQRQWAAQGGGTVGAEPARLRTCGWPGVAVAPSMLALAHEGEVIAQSAYAAGCRLLALPGPHTTRRCLQQLPGRRLAPGGVHSMRYCRCAQRTAAAAQYEGPSRLRARAVKPECASAAKGPHGEAQHTLCARARCAHSRATTGGLASQGRRSRAAASRFSLVAGAERGWTRALPAPQGAGRRLLRGTGGRRWARQLARAPPTRDGSHLGQLLVLCVGCGGARGIQRSGVAPTIA